MEWLIEEKVAWVASWININYSDKLFKTIPTTSKKFSDKCSELSALNNVLKIGVEKQCGDREHIGTSYYEDIVDFVNDIHHKIWQTQNNDYRHRLVCGKKAIENMLIEYLKKWRTNE